MIKAVIIYKEKGKRKRETKRKSKRQKEKEKKKRYNAICFCVSDLPPFFVGPLLVVLPDLAEISCLEIVVSAA